MVLTGEEQDCPTPLVFAHMLVAELARPDSDPDQRGPNLPESDPKLPESDPGQSQSGQSLT